MRDFGMGKIAAEENIQAESERVIDVFKSHRGEPFDPENVINMAVANIICSFAFGERYAYDDAVFRHSLGCMNTMMRKFAGKNVPLLIKLFPKMTFWLFKGRIKEIFATYEGFASFARRGVREHKAKFDGTVHDLIDAYLKEMESQKDNPDSIYSGAYSFRNGGCHLFHFHLHFFQGCKRTAHFPK